MIGQTNKQTDKQRLQLDIYNNFCNFVIFLSEEINKIHLSLHCDLQIISHSYGVLMQQLFRQGPLSSVARLLPFV